MGIEASDVIAFGAFVLTGLIYMKAGRKSVVWLLISIGFLSLIFSIFSRVNKTKAAVSQSASASGGSTINQAGRDINQRGLSDEDRKMLHDLVIKKSVDGMAEFAARYRHGYLIFGLSPDGRPVTYQSALRDVSIWVNWSDLKVELLIDSNRLRVSTPNIRLRFQNGTVGEFYGNVEEMPFVENEPMVSGTVRNMCYEVLDAEKKIFLIGFK